MPMSESMSASSREAESLNEDVKSIIKSGQTADRVPSRVVVVALISAISVTMLWACFTPLDFAPLAWIALVPLTQLLRLQTLPHKTYRTLYCVAFLGWLATLQWMRLGHPAMYLALVALSVYLALYIPTFILTGHLAIRSGCPLWLVVPLVWTALEFARAYLMTGFSWYYLGHSQYQWDSLIQISDLGGAYIVSFIVAMGNWPARQHDSFGNG